MTRLKVFLLRVKCPATALIAQLFVGLVLFFLFIESQNISKNVIGNDRIRTKLGSLAEKCGPDHFWTWIVIDEKANNYYFQDVIGCNPSKLKKCAFSVKYAGLNPSYQQTHHFSDNTSLKFLNNLDTGMAAYFDDMGYFNQYKTISSAFARSNKKIETVGLSITKDFHRNLVYLFLKTSTNKNPANCSKAETVQLLEELSIYAKGNL